MPSSTPCGGVGSDAGAAARFDGGGWGLRRHRAESPAAASGLLPFEFGLLTGLEAQGFVDAHLRCAPGQQIYSWVGRTGEGYRYDYLHVGQALADRIDGCAYLHETREQRLTDHAAATLDLGIDSARRMGVRDDAEADAALSLF